MDVFKNRIKKIKFPFKTVKMQHRNKRVFLSASMTLEAAFIIPFFTFCVLALVYVINLLNYQSRVNTILYDVSRNTSKLEYNLEDSAAKAVGVALFYSKIAAAGTDGMSIIGGSAAMVPIFTDKDDEFIKLGVTYTAKSPVSFMGISSLICSQSLQIRKWVGNEDKGSGDGTGSDGSSTKKTMVYITQTGTVYHTNRSCSYLVLSIRSVSYSQLDSLRNTDGGKYYACERCMYGKEAVGTVYITDWGDRYHDSRNCSGLKRSVMTVPLDSITGYRQCSRCAQSA